MDVVYFYIIKLYYLRKLYGNFCDVKNLEGHTKKENVKNWEG